MNCLQYYCAKTLEIAIKINVGRTILRILERERINKVCIRNKTSFLHCKIADMNHDVRKNHKCPTLFVV